MKRLNIGAAVILLLAAVMMPAIAVAKPKPPAQVAKQTVQDILNRMDGHRDELRNNPAKLHQLIQQELVPHFDLPYMSQLVLGRYWRQASPDQRQKFQTAFKNMLIQNYGDTLLKFDKKDQIDYLPVRAADNAKNVTFKAVFHPAQGQPIDVSLKLHQVDDQWKIYDGTAGHLSFVTNYRSQFTNRIQKVGLAKFIQQMQQRYNTNS